MCHDRRGVNTRECRLIETGTDENGRGFMDPFRGKWGY